MSDSGSKKSGAHPGLRVDPFRGYPVFIAEDRSNRPHQIDEACTDRCPFCAGNESDTPPPITQYADPSGEHPWLMRVVPNKFPALDPNLHEVIIEGPKHTTEFRKLPPAIVRQTIRVYRDRLRHHAKNPNVKYVQIFKNSGAAAGASLSHCHSQVIALPLLPIELEREIQACAEHWAKQKRSLLSDLISETSAEQDRVVIESDRYIAFTPFASRFPYQICLAAKSADACFGNQSDQQCDEFADMIQELLHRMAEVTNNAAYNIVLHNPPAHENNAGMQWRCDIFPRLGTAAGLEWGSGCFINTVSPESAAKSLRMANSAD